MNVIEVLFRPSFPLLSVLLLAFSAYVFGARRGYRDGRGSK